MNKNKKIAKIMLSLVTLLVCVIYLSVVSVRIWGGKAEKIEADITVTFSNETTIIQLANSYKIPKPVIKKVFNLEDKKDLNKKINSFGLSEDQINSAINKEMALHSEDQSKNWKKIAIKFILWLAFLSTVFILIRKKKTTPSIRKALYIIAIFVFGVSLGADPSPMGTVKDAVVLFGIKGVIFPQRMIAMTVLLITVFIANKFICSWGCQIGTLQDLIFRFNRNSKDTKGVLAQFKIPFVITNSIRVLFFIALAITAVFWSFDLVEHIDPFKIFKPATLTTIGWIFIGLILTLSLFTYRPWCHLFCPFGLTSWLVEKLSIFKIQVDYNKCTACNSCTSACPSTAMDSILKQNKVVNPDCFSCNSCIDACPTSAITFNRGKRDKAPQNKFK